MRREPLSVSAPSLAVASGLWQDGQEMGPKAHLNSLRPFSSGRAQRTGSLDNRRSATGSCVVRLISFTAGTARRPKVLSKLGDVLEHCRPSRLAAHSRRLRHAADSTQREGILAVKTLVKVARYGLDQLANKVSVMRDSTEASLCHLTATTLVLLGGFGPGFSPCAAYKSRTEISHYEL